MAVAVKKYNPGFLSDDEIIQSFCVRTHEFESIVESLREMSSSSSTHSLVIGSRGSGKTHLLLRVAAEVRRAPDLSGIFPVVFAEESYEVTTCGEFWLECLGRVADLAPSDEQASLLLTYDDLRTVSDDRALADRCLGSLLDFADRHDTRLLLIVENLNMLFSEMSDPDVGWQLRKTLQTEPRIVLLGSATSRFEEIDSPEHALYDLFRVLTLRPLDTAGCEALWQSVSGKPSVGDTVRPLEILTGGSPRLIAIIARFGADRSFADLMNNLLDLVDEHTEYFKSHLEALPPQERRVYLALARLWKPATAREVADQARLDTNACSAQLRRLVERGVVAIEGGTPRRREYYLTERLYNIYYLLRRGAGTHGLVTVLIEFMVCLYSPAELSNVIKSLVRDAQVSDRMRNVPEHFANALIDEAEELRKDGMSSEALEICDQVIKGLGLDATAYADYQMARAIACKSRVLLGLVGRTQEAIAVCDDFMRRYGSRVDSDLPTLVAYALSTKALALWNLDELTAAIKICDQAIVSLDKDEGQKPHKFIRAFPFLLKALLLSDSGRPMDALTCFDEVVRQCGPCPESEVAAPVAMALACKATILGRLDQTISEREFSVLLTCLAKLDAELQPPETINGILGFVASVGVSRTLELIQESPAADMLLPLVTALQLELGQDPQVAKEVQEVAEDTRARLIKVKGELRLDGMTGSARVSVRKPDTA